MAAIALQDAHPLPMLRSFRMLKSFVNAANILTPLWGLSFGAAHQRIETHCIILPYPIHDRRSHG